MGLALPLDPVPWWTHFDADEADLVRVCGMLLALYRDWGAAGAAGAGVGDAVGVGMGSEGKGRVNVWRRAGGLPITKAGVREVVARGMAQEGEGEGEGERERDRDRIGNGGGRGR